MKKRTAGAWLLVYVFVMLVSLFTFTCAHAQEKYGLVTRSAARETAAAWRADSVNASERGYCIAGPMSWASGELRADKHDSAFFVWRVTQAKAITAGPDSLRIDCGWGVPTLHTHPCGQGVCDCNPSREDRSELDRTRAPFSVVQCGENQYVFYFRRKVS